MHSCTGNGVTKRWGGELQSQGAGHITDRPLYRLYCWSTSGQHAVHVCLAPITTNFPVCSRCKYIQLHCTLPPAVRAALLRTRDVTPGTVPISLRKSANAAIGIAQALIWIPAYVVEARVRNCE